MGKHAAAAAEKSDSESLSGWKKVAHLVKYAEAGWQANWAIGCLDLDVLGQGYRALSMAILLIFPYFPVMPSAHLTPADDVHIGGQHVHHFAFALVAPLGSQDDVHL